LTTLIGLLGGTFDPVHNGHLAVARAVCAALDMSRVHLILNAQPPHREPPACAVGHRLAMLQTAAAGEPWVVTDTRELARTGPSYTLWTLRSLRRELPEASLCWIVGIDAWLDMGSWYHLHELSSLAHLLIVKRPGWELSSTQAAQLSRDVERLGRQTAGSRVLFEGPEMDVSATEIRTRIAARRDLEELLPAPVWAYIKREGLYGYQQSVT